MRKIRHVTFDHRFELATSYGGTFHDNFGKLAENSRKLSFFLPFPPSLTFSLDVPRPAGYNCPLSAAKPPKSDPISGLAWFVKPFRGAARVALHFHVAPRFRNFRGSTRVSTCVERESFLHARWRTTKPPHPFANSTANYVPTSPGFNPGIPTLSGISALSSLLDSSS